MLKKIVTCGLFVLVGSTPIPAQHSDQIRPEINSPSFALKSNLLYDATTTFNLGAEFRIADRWTVDVSGNYNPWTFSNRKKVKHIGVQPELRYWLCEPFNKHFLGVHAHYAYYNVENVKLPMGIFSSWNDQRFQGWLTGLGVSYGYQWYLSPHWNVEFNLGLGYAYLKYKEYDCGPCGDYIGSSHTHYFGPTKAALSLIYLIR